VATDSVVFHKEGASIGTSSRARRSELSQYYLSRNLLVFYWKYRPWLLPIALLRNLREAWRHFWRRDRALAGITLRATGDALLGQTGKRA
jgi:hypothetical protein